QFGIGDPYYAAFFSVPMARYFYATEPLSYIYDWFVDDIYHGAVFSTGAISFNYMYRIKKWLWIGGSATYCGFFSKVHNLVTDEVVGKNNVNTFSFYPSVRFSYLNRKYVTLYSGVSLGYTFIFGNRLESRYSQSYFTGQITAIGVSVGKTWYGFTELGLGMRGCISAGFGYRFKSVTK
ncbi:MAG: hypothetical protein RR034_08915, partial [Bacteroidales bacterium]